MSRRTSFLKKSRSKALENSKVTFWPAARQFLSSVLSRAMFRWLKSAKARRHPINAKSRVLRVALKWVISVFGHGWNSARPNPHCSCCDGVTPRILARALTRRCWRTLHRAPIEGQHELFAFLTTEANAIVAPIHPKAMPVILSTPEDVDLGLAADSLKAFELQRRLPTTGSGSSPAARKRTGSSRQLNHLKARFGSIDRRKAAERGRRRSQRPVWGVMRSHQGGHRPKSPEIGA
jgi:hypothetical protein